MSSTKKIIYILIIFIFFSYGLIAGVYKLFPFHQLLALKHYVEFSTDNFEENEAPITDEKAQVLATHLQRLLIKKIKIPGYSGHGGGIANTSDILYIVTNKGTVKTFNLKTYTSIGNKIPKVPLNFDALILSGITTKNNFVLMRFRVNGIYTESINNNMQVLFVSHNAYNSQKECITHNISRIELTVSNGSVTPTSDWETIFTAAPCINPQPEHYLAAGGKYAGHISGGAIVNFNKDKLLVTVGDYDRNGINGVDQWAMDPSNPYGKFILVDKKTGEWSIYAMGSRNATGIYIDKNSVIWSVENGPRGGDELNIIQKDKNYGWPEVSYGIWYNFNFKLPGGYKEGTYPAYQKPVFAWVPSIAPSDIIKITFAKFDYWKGDFLIGTMRDRGLRRLRLNGKNHVIYDERIELGHRVRDITILPDGKIALITDDGYLIIIGDGGPVFKKIDNTIKKRIKLLNKFDQLFK